jgi:low temperature requirement protein LtrA
MQLLKKTFRHWWQQPRKIADATDERSVSFLELFYDLSYVVIIAELAHILVKDLNLLSVFGFIGLFILVWWAWSNGTFYHELHGNNDLRTRIFTFSQMFALAGMAIFAHNALSVGYVGFAVSYAFFLLILGFLWMRTGVHDVTHRNIFRPYSLGFFATAIVFIISAFTPIEISFYLWALGAAVSLLLPLLFTRENKRIDKVASEHAKRIRPSLVERFGLLTIIVLGEVIVAVVRAASHYEVLNISQILITFFGLSIAVGMWWVYFDFVSHKLPVQVQKWRYFWMYLHLPLTMAIAATGAGVLTVLKHFEGISNQETWLLVVPIAVFLLCTGLVIRTLDTKTENIEMQRQGRLSILFSSFLVVSFGFFKLSPLWLLGLINLALLIPILFAFRLWIKRIHKKIV